MAVDLDEAFKRAVRSFYEGAGFPEYEKSTGKKLKYNKEGFDGYEKVLRKGLKKAKKDLDKSDKPLEETED